MGIKLVWSIRDEALFLIKLDLKFKLLSAELIPIIFVPPLLIM